VTLISCVFRSGGCLCFELPVPQNRAGGCRRWWLNGASERVDSHVGLAETLGSADVDNPETAFRLSVQSAR